MVENLGAHWQQCVNDVIPGRKGRWTLYEMGSHSWRISYAFDWPSSHWDYEELPKNWKVICNGQT